MFTEHLPQFLLQTREQFFYSTLNTACSLLNKDNFIFKAIVLYGKRSLTHLSNSICSVEK